MAFIVHLDTGAYPFSECPAPALTTRRCDNCEEEKPQTDVKLFWVYGTRPDAFTPRLMLVCSDCNIALTAQGARLEPTPTPEEVLHAEQVRRWHDNNPHAGKHGG